MATYLFDLESDGLLDELTRIHCLVLKDAETGEVHSFTPSEVEAGVRMLQTADLIIGHNVICFDIPALRKVFPWFSIERTRVRDTLTCSRLIWPDLSDRDRAKIAKGSDFPPKMVGRHSLASWGHRLNEHKGDYQGGWEQWSEEMQHYCEQDVEVTDRLWKLIESKDYSARAIELEHSVQWVVSEQEGRGFGFNRTAAVRLYQRLVERRLELEAELQDAFPPWEEELGEFIPKVNNKKLGYVKGVPVMKTKEMVFNPGSRQHIAKRLIAIRGWKPKEFTNDGHAKVDEAVLASLPYPEANLMSEYLMIQKRIGMLAEGAQAWLKAETEGRIYGSVITNGAVTGRATHRSPNVAQTPAVGAPYGEECRALFVPTGGRKLVGVDVSGLELRMLGHYMSRWDEGEYADVVINGDIHTVNQKAAGLENRPQAKTFIYAFLYGAGAAKIGSIVGKGAAVGSKLKKKFLAQTPALKHLIEAVQSKAEQQGHLTGLDGRRLHIRSNHAALNTLLQSAGAIVCKQWMVNLDEALRLHGLHDKCGQVAWVHDELQIEADEDCAEQVGQLAVDAILTAGSFLDVRVPLTGEYKVGNNWAETH